MTTERVLLRDLILETRDGDWGNEIAKEGYVPYRVIRGGDFPDIEIGNIENIPQCFLKETTVHRRTLKDGDLLIETAGGTRDRATGRVLFITNDLLSSFDLPVTCASFARFIRLKTTKANPKYVFWFLRNMYLRGEMWQHQVQHTGVARFQFTKFADSEFVDLPSRPVQDHIVEILDSLTGKIVLNRQLNQTLEQIAQAIFKSWFVDFEPVKAKIQAKTEGRDPKRAAMCAISGKSDEELVQLTKKQYQELAATAALFPDDLVDSELGEIPKGWKWLPLYETAEYVNGAAFKADDFSQDGKGLPIIKIAELKQGITAQTQFTAKSFPDKYEIRSGDILYSWSGSPETSLEVFKWFGDAGWLNQHIFKLSFESEDQKYFAFFLLRHMKPLLIQTAKDKQTTGLGHITVADMKRIKIVYPDGAVLKLFSRVISPLYEKDSILSEQSNTLSALRDSLLPKLLSGEIELKKCGVDS